MRIASSSAATRSDASRSPPLSRPPTSQTAPTGLKTPKSAVAEKNEALQRPRTPDEPPPDPQDLARQTFVVVRDYRQIVKQEVIVKGKN